MSIYNEGKLMTKIAKVEESLNSVTHLIGAGMAISGLVALIMRSVNLGTKAHIVSFTIFGVALILLYTMSGVYHLLPEGKSKEVFKVLDHSAIYILISGSYTPYLLTVLGGAASVIIFIAQWTMTTLGIIFKVKFAGRFRLLSTLIYLFMGWMIIFVYKDLKLAMPPKALHLLIACGISYSVGSIFYMMKKLYFSHVIWHLFVIGGSVCNFLSVYYLV